MSVDRIFYSADYNDGIKPAENCFWAYVGNVVGPKKHDRPDEIATMNPVYQLLVFVLLPFVFCPGSTVMLRLNIIL